MYTFLLGSKEIYSEAGKVQKSQQCKGLGEVQINMKHFI